MTELAELVRDYTSDRDLIVFSGDITPYTAELLRAVLDRCGTTHAKISLILTTNGGDPHAAYRMARCLQRDYREIRLVLCGDCKSAGTLIALAAHGLAFSRRGELGPLDIQMTKPDELFSFGSGLDTTGAVTMLTGYGWVAFADYVDKLVGNGLSTRVSAEIASNLAVGLFAPLGTQVDPLRVAEADRANRIAYAYGERIGTSNVKPDTLRKLIYDYPAHAFVIDEQEAAKLFEVVESLSEMERRIADAIAIQLGNIVTFPPQNPVILNAVEEWAMPTAEEEGQDGTSARGGHSSVSASSERNSGDAGAPDGGADPTPAAASSGNGSGPTGS